MRAAHAHGGPASLSTISMGRLNPILAGASEMAGNEIKSTGRKLFRHERKQLIHGMYQF